MYENLLHGIVFLEYFMYFIKNMQIVPVLL